MTNPEFHVVAFGATSFVGEILCRYLTEHFGVDGELKWAAAGRSESKLRALRESLGEPAADLELLTADAGDEDALRRMCERACVVVSTVGPYALYGEPLVRVCAETGTDYCDLTGEVQWIRRMIERYERKASESGARIVHCCGFDSIPSDLGVFFMQQHALEQFGEPLTDVKMRIKMRGAASGGTAASMLNLFKELAANPSLRKELRNPYSICPPGHPFTARQHNVTSAEYDTDFGAWAAPFVMGAVNTRIVHRSNALSDNAYGESFLYDEAMLTGRGFKGRTRALGLAAGLGGFMLSGAFSPTRRLLEKFVVPAPGEGPSPEAQARGFFNLRFVGKTTDGRKLLGKVTGDMDPGYGSTAKMLGQAAACLALDFATLDKPGGFWTPTTMFSEKLIERLRAHAGLTFEPLEQK